MRRPPILRAIPTLALGAWGILGLVSSSCAPAMPGASPLPPVESPTVSVESSSAPSQLRVDPSFSQAYLRLGGPTWFGPAVSQAFLDPDLGWKLQVFEFGVLAEDPGSSSAFPLWINTLLGRQTAPGKVSADPNCRYISATGHNVCSAFLKFYDSGGFAHLGSPLSEMALDASGTLHQDFEYESLDLVGGFAQLAPLGQSFFVARRYSTSLLQPEFGAALSQVSPLKVDALATPSSPSARAPATDQSPLAFPNGFSVGPPFLAAYLKAGGEPWLGTALSQPFEDPDLGWRIQVFDYGALAQESRVDQVFLVPINTLLGREVAASPPKLDPACRYFQASGHNVCYQFLTYLQRQGIERMGLPISELQEDPEGILFQDFEYLRLEWLNGQVCRQSTGQIFLRQQLAGEAKGP